jgi:radial spoke head protein 9
LDLSEELKNFSHNGVTLNLDERMQLEMALGQLRASIEADEVLFWGKVTGLNADYYVALAVTFQGMYEFPQKQFYWTLSSTPDFKFKEMPGLGLPMPEQDAFIDSSATYFMGEPQKLLNQKSEEEEDAPAEEAPAEEEEEEAAEKAAKDSQESEEEEIKVPKRNLTEVNRLALVVNAIENDCHVCPMGAFKMTPQHELCRAEAFRGLAKADASNLSSYQHFRNVQHDDKKALLDKSDAPFHKDVLDPIEGDQPKGCWSLQMDERAERTVLRSLSWPGFQFFHRVGSNKFGNVYIGNGLKDQAVHFIV